MSHLYTLATSRAWILALCLHCSLAVAQHFAAHLESCCLRRRAELPKMCTAVNVDAASSACCKLSVSTIQLGVLFCFCVASPKPCSGLFGNTRCRYYFPPLHCIVASYVCVFSPCLYPNTDMPKGRACCSATCSTPQGPGADGAPCYSESHLQSGTAHALVRHGCNACQSATSHFQTTARNLVAASGVKWADGQKSL